MARYENPAAAISACKRQGKRGSHALYICALGRRPGADARWVGAAKHLAATNGLSGAKGRKKGRKKRKGQLGGWGSDQSLRTFCASLHKTKGAVRKCVKQLRKAERTSINWQAKTVRK